MIDRTAPPFLSSVDQQLAAAVGSDAAEGLKTNAAEGLKTNARENGVPNVQFQGKSTGWRVDMTAL